MKKFFHILVALVLLAPMTTLSSCGDMHHLHGVDCPSGDCDDNANGGNNGGDAYSPNLRVGQTFTATVEMAPAAMNHVPFVGDNGVSGEAVSSSSHWQYYFRNMTAPIRVTVKVDQELRDPNGGPSLFTFRIIGVY